MGQAPKCEKSGGAAVFRGVQHINMDAKGRLAVPTRHRERLIEQCDGDVIVTVDPRAECLALYPLPEWEVIEQDLHNHNSKKASFLNFKRLFLGYATDVKLDGSGRLLLPATHREHAKLEKEVVLLGQLHKFEIWSESVWIRQRDVGLEAARNDTSGELEEDLSGVNV